MCDARSEVRGDVMLTVMDGGDDDGLDKMKSNDGSLVL
jgi:hypothetical protein